MDEWSLPHTAMGFACWDLTNSAVSLLTVYPKKPVPCGWFVLCTLIMTWFWQQSSLLHTVRSPQGALVDGSLCISQSFRHNLHQMRNSSGVWLINYFNLGEVFSFLEDLISLDQDLGSYGSVNIYIYVWPEYLAFQRHPGISISTSQPCSVSIPLLLSVPLSLGFPGHSACVSSPHPCLHHSSLPPPPFLILVWILWTFGRSLGWDEKPMALVLNKTQTLDVGTLVIEKVHFHLSVYLAFKVAAKYWAQ